MYFANWTLIIFADDTHLVDTTIAYGFVIAFSHSYKFGLIGT